MTQFLFIGGPADGQWKQADHEHWQVPVYPTPAVAPYVRWPTEPDADHLCFTATYRKRFWRSDKGVYEMYVLDSMTDSEAMQRLLTHYRPKEP